MVQKLTPQQVRRIEEIEEFQNTVSHVKSLVAELESNRAAKATVVSGILSSIARELSQMRQRAMTADVGQLADVAGTLSVLASRLGGINFKIRGLTEGIASLTMQLDHSLKEAKEAKEAMEPERKGKGKKPS